MPWETAIQHTAADSDCTKKQLKLYKYMTPIAFASLLEHGDIKLAYRNETNDLFECLPEGYGVDEDVLLHLGIVSFTSKATNHPMWGNYADKFRGVCVEFEIDYFHIDPCKKPQNKGEYLAKEGIEYKSIGTDVYFFQYWEDEKHELIDTRGGDVILKCKYSDKRSDPNSIGIINTPEDHRRWQQRLWRQVSTKHTDWKYEEEYRATMRHQRCSRCQIGLPVMYFSNTFTRYITKIILGPRCEYTTADVLYIIKKQRGKFGVNAYMPENVKVVKASIRKDSFDIDIPDNGELLPDMY